MKISNSKYKVDFKQILEQSWILNAAYYLKKWSINETHKHFCETHFYSKQKYRLHRKIMLCMGWYKTGPLERKYPLWKLLPQKGNISQPVQEITNLLGDWLHHKRTNRKFLLSPRNHLLQKYWITLCLIKNTIYKLMWRRSRSKEKEKTEKKRKESKNERTPAQKLKAPVHCLQACNLGVDLMRNSRAGVSDGA